MFSHSAQNLKKNLGHHGSQQGADQKAKGCFACSNSRKNIKKFARRISVFIFGLTEIE